MFRTVPLSIIRSCSLYTQQWYMLYKFVVCTLKNSCWWTEEMSKNKSEKLVLLVCFIIRIYHDARSPERQKMWFKLCTRFMLYCILLFHPRRRRRKEREWSCITWMDSYISDIGQDRAIRPLYKHGGVWTIRISGWSGSLNRLQQQCSKAKRTVILQRQCSRITVIMYKRYLFLHLSGLLKSLLE